MGIMKNSTVKFIPLVALFVSLFSLQIFGLSLTQESLDFRSAIEKAEENCPSLNCARGPLKLKNIDLSFFSQTQPVTMNQLTEIANSIAHTEWPDTVLSESFYVTEINPKIVLLSTILDSKSKALIGYRIMYSNPAWNLAHCNFDDQKPESLRVCQEGFFRELGFVSADLKVWFRDPVTMVEFAPKF